MDPTKPITVYKASAGSGKTFRLALDYIRLLLGTCDEHGHWHVKKRYDNAHRSILAITFTNKATNEMKGRIVRELAILAGREPRWGKKKYMELLRNDFDCSEKELAAVASQALKAILEDYGFFNISTIDAFFQVVLRTFAREANLMGNYEIDLDKSGAYKDAVDVLLTRITRSDFLEARTLTEKQQMAKLREWVVKYMIEFAQNGRTFNLLQRNSQVRENLCRFLDNLTNEEFERNDQIKTYLDDLNRLDRFREAIIGERNRLWNTEMPQLIEDSQACAASLSGLLKNVKWMENSLKDLCKTIPTSLQKFYESEDGKYVLNAAANKRGLSPDEEKIHAVLHSYARQLFCDICRYNVLGKTLDSVYRLGLLGTVRKIINETMAEKDSFLLSDTNALLREIIGDDDTPFVYERMGLWLKHYLIDEFQDTSQLQWDNLKPLVKESLGVNNYNLIIGDEKQCIYRWRGSKPELLTNIATKDFPCSTDEVGTRIQDNTNWRSSSEVVRFNNTLFTQIARTLGSSVYNNVVQQVSPGKKDERGYVVVRKAEPVDGMNEIETSFELTVNEICRQLDAGYRFSDIAVLFRKTSEASDFINYIYAQKAEHKQLDGIRIVSEDSMRISSSPAVNRVVNLIRFMVSSDYVPRLDSHKKKKSQRDFIAFTHRLEGPVAAGDVSHADFADALTDTSTKEKMEEILQAAKYSTSTLSSIVRQLIMRFLSEEDRARECAYLEAFEDLVLDFSTRPGGGNFAGFIDWWDKKGCTTSVSSAGNVNALTVMTIHKAKGLEFNCVHIPVLDTKLPNDDVVWFAPQDMDSIPSDCIPSIIPLKVVKEMDYTGYREAKKDFETRKKIDEINVLYVALTRAARELSVVLTNNNPEIYNLIDNALGALSQEGAVTSDTLIKIEAEGNTFFVGTPTMPAEKDEAKAKDISVLDPTETETFVIPAYNHSRNPFSNTSLDLNPETL